jgi:hypothetical protein
VALEPSNAARSQAYITRARIGFVVYARILNRTVGDWHRGALAATSAVARQRG